MMMLHLLKLSVLVNVRSKAAKLLTVAVNWFRCIYPFTGERCSRKVEEDIDAFEIIGDA